MSEHNNFDDFNDDANNFNNADSSIYNVSNNEDDDATTSMSISDIESASKKSSDDLFNNVSESYKNGVKDRVKNRSASAFIYSLLIVLVLIIAGYCLTAWYFHDRVVPGVHFGNEKFSEQIVGKKSDEVAHIVEQAISDSSFEISDNRGGNLTSSLGDMKVKSDVQATVRNIISAKHDNLFTMLMPWVTRNVPLSAQRNDSEMNKSVVTYFVKDKDRAIPFTSNFDEKESKFVVKDGEAGSSVETLPVREAVKKMIANPGHVAKVSVVYRRVDSPIQRDEAQKLTDQLNSVISNEIKFDNGNGKDFVVPKNVISKWISIDVDEFKHKLSYDIDSKAVNDLLSGNLPKQLNQVKVNQEDSVDKNGKVIFTATKGVDGVSIKYSDSVLKQVVDALKNKKAVKISVPSEVSKFSVERKLVEMRIVVDKSSQTATVYKNDEVVKTFPVCTGQTNLTESDSGTFHIYLRYDVKTMRGRHYDGRPYVLPGIRWVSFYNGGESFHTAAWNSVGIATGDPARHGSNGCVNMYEADAHWIYDNCPRGTIVQVIGETPENPVRP